jgi:hypothetical protein
VSHATRTATASTVLLLAALAQVPVTAAPAVTAEAPVHQVSVTGDGVSTYPAYDDSTARYGVRTTDATDGTLVVDATTSDPGGRVLVDGRPVTGTVTVTGLVPRDEVSVIFSDSGGTEVHSYIYLPTDFPELTATATKAAQRGHTMVTLNDFTGNPARFRAVLDGNAVPRFVERYAGSSHDFKKQPDGSYSVSTDIRDGQPTDERILELDSRLAPVAEHRTVGLVDTDFHDSIFLPGGHRILMAYEPRQDGSGLLDSVIEEQDADGDPVFTWSTEDHVDLAAERITGSNDYAHLNSLYLLDDGDLLVSFRGLSSVFRIARTPRAGVAVGDVVWRLGGRRSDFTFPGDPFGGPCAQHTATQTSAPGEPLRVMVFDNGALAQMCIDQADRDGPAHARTQSRAVEYELDEDAGTATKVFEHAPDGFFGAFTGSAFRMANGNTLIGWGNNVQETAASEVDADGNVLWTLQNPDDGPGDPVANYGSYRFHRAVVPDAVAPEPVLTVPQDGAVYAYGADVDADYGCTDRGGSDLVACSAPSSSGGPLDTSVPGTHTFTVTARDGDGNTATQTHTYTVLSPPVPTDGPTPTPTPTPTATPTPTPTPGPTPRGPVPDAAIVLRGDVVGDGVRGVRQRARTTLTARRPVRRARIRLANTGDVAAALTVRGPTRLSTVRLRATLDGTDVTRRLRRGTLGTPSLAPGERAVLRITVSRRPHVDLPARRVLRFRVSAGAAYDAVQLVVRVE